MATDGAAAFSPEAAAAAGAIPGLVWAFRIRPNQPAEPLPIDHPLPAGPDGALWLHFNLADARALHWLSSANLPGPARALLLSKDSYQQLHSAEDVVYGVIADMIRDIGEATDDTGSLRFVMTEALLITGRHQALCAVETTRRALEVGQRVESIAGLFEAIVENVADTLERIIDRHAQALDRTEEKVLSDDAEDLRQDLGRLRRTCVRLHRQLSGLRIVFHRLDREVSPDLKPALRLRARKLAQRLDGLDHSVVEMRERSRLLQEELHLKIEQQGNDSIRALSVMTALLLPPTLVTGFFGMNTKSLPFGELEGGSFWAAGAMLLASLVAYLVMKRIGLIR